MNTKIRMLAWCAGVVLVLVPSVVRADLFIDFGTLSARHSVGAADANGNWWNYVTGASDVIADMVNDDDTSSGYSLTMGAGWVGMNGLGGATDWGILSGDVDPALNNGDFGFHQVVADGAFISPNTSATITLGGLNDALTYDFVFYGARSATGPLRITTYAVGASSDTLVTSGPGIGDGGTVNWNTSNTASLSGISPSGGSIVLTVSNNGQFGYLNAMQITAVPEPASLSLLLLAGLSLRALRRRQA